MNGDILNRKPGGNQPGDGGNQPKDPAKQKLPGEEKQAGRKELEDDKKSEKTIANRESMN